MEREPYWDYMARRLREENNKMSPIENDMASLTKAHYNVLQRLKEVTSINYELEEKIAYLNGIYHDGNGDLKQLEFEF